MNSEETKYFTKIWEFIRGDLQTKELEVWCCGTEGLEKFFGKEMYLSLIGTNFKNDPSVSDLKKNIKEWVESNFPRSCHCPTFKNKEKIVLGDKFVWVPESEDDFARHFEILKSRNDWVELVRCKHCGEYWYVAIDTYDDDVYFRRIKTEEVEPIMSRGKWPKDYDGMKNVKL